MDNKEENPLVLLSGALAEFAMTLAEMDEATRDRLIDSWTWHTKGKGVWPKPYSQELLSAMGRFVRSTDDVPLASVAMNLLLPKPRVRRKGE